MKINNALQKNAVSLDFAKNQSTEYDGDSEEQFFDKPAITTGTQDIMCGNITILAM